MEAVDRSIDQLRDRLARARRVTALTGAGVSAESGIPTFRGPGGLWEGRRPEELATEEAFFDDPTAVWRWYDWRRGSIAACEPNPAHRALVELERRVPEFTLVTQNVDGLHRRAGSRRVLELHGSIWRVRCTRCGWRGENRDVPIGPLPSCSLCTGMLRPDVVWFGEAIPNDVLANCYDAVRRCEVLVVVGTSGLVQPAAAMASVARRAGAFVAEVNIEPPAGGSAADILLIGRAGDLLPRLVPEAA